MLKRIKSCIKTKKCFGTLLASFVFVHLIIYIYKVKTFNFDTSSKQLRSESAGSIRNVFDYEKCLIKNVLFLKRMGFNSSEEEAKFRCSHLMSFSGNPSGRLGNTMFQVASVIGLATWHNYTPVFNEKFHLFKVFKLINRINFAVKNTEGERDRVCCKHSKHLHQLDHSKNWTLSGYLQSWKYFHDARDVVKKAFTFKTKYTTEASNFLKSVRKEGFINVCIHVRRGDFESKRNVELGYTVAPLSYIQKAMQFFRHKFREVSFLFVSDDINWCKKTFQNANYHFSPFKDPVLDMALMASCDHVIVSTGTYGWMGAWLAGGMTVYYAGFPRRGSWLETQFNTDGNFSDYYPNNWIGMH